MSAYNLELSRQAAKDLEKVYRSDRTLYQRFINAFNDIAKRPEQGKTLRGKLSGLYSHRMGSYRIIYEIHRHKLLVIILDLGHRKDVYR
ncbi:MAG: hypothetical protein A3I43_01315 [Omnitrophica WOR_2 bacterium RIFCSPLOWO2_02_FULL_50_19]|nr:MAG: hypothetical protein A3I43_01315 [Omnitrophica WOR_2 bacterium RIFCSPLOWO2_02_FULL_50_19]